MITSLLFRFSLRMSDKSSIPVQEFLHQKGDKVTEAEYVYEENQGNGKKRQHRVHVKRNEFEDIAATNKKMSLSFDDFITVVRPFLMGDQADKDIPEAFHLLDADSSGFIDIAELAVFMPAIVPGSNQYMLLRHFQVADTNKDYKLSFEEFTEFIKKGVIRDLALGRL